MPHKEVCISCLAILSFSCCLLFESHFCSSQCGFQPHTSWWGAFMSFCISDLSPIQLLSSSLPDSGLHTLGSSLKAARCCGQMCFLDIWLTWAVILPLSLISCMDVSKWLYCCSLGFLIFKMGKINTYLTHIIIGSVYMTMPSKWKQLHSLYTLWAPMVLFGMKSTTNWPWTLYSCLFSCCVVQGPNNKEGKLKQGNYLETLDTQRANNTNI